MIKWGKNGFSPSIHKDWTKEQFVEKYANIPKVNELWEEIEKANGKDSKPIKKASKSTTKTRSEDTV